MVLSLAPQSAALYLLPAITAISLWVAWSDLKFMKIPNAAVLVLAGVYLFVGFLLLPIDLWAWGWILGLLVLVVGMMLNVAGLVGAGDAKFSAAMAPFFVGGDPRIVLMLLAGCLLAAFVAHRLLGTVPAYRRATADWASWHASDFPMGLALAGTILFYFLLSLDTPA